MSTDEFRGAVHRYAAVVRERHFSGRDPVLSGAFDRFISALARQAALDLHDEYGNDDKISINDLSSWHGTGSDRDRISRDKFDAMCSAHGIPQEILIDNGTAGRAYFDTVFSRHLMESFGWSYSDAL